MNIEASFKNIEKQLKNHDQGHLLAFWQQLEPDEKLHFLKQFDLLELEKIDEWIEKKVKKIDSPVQHTDFSAAPFFPANASDNKQKQQYEQAINLGKALISEGKVAAFVVAGGQGTRLGFDGPKGSLPTSPVKKKSLFQLFAEIIAAASKKYQVDLPWYIMTSPLNDADTKQILHSNDFFGLNEKNVFIFQQGTLPNFSFDGKLLLADKSTIASSPDGHGGSLKALYNSGAVENMKKRGVEFISYFQVDNPLINIFDPLFIGLHAKEKAEMSSKAVIKTGPMEKVGNFCLVDGRITVIEYSDLPEKLALSQKPDGSLVFELGSIAIHIINTSFVEKLNAAGFALPLHRAVKKIAHIDANGVHVDPTEPNAVKLESFVFDALPLASKSIILQTPRNEEFAPIKNATGVDSSESARKMMIERAAAWLESAGVNVPRKPAGPADCTIEIAPAFALDKKDIKARSAQIPTIKPKDSVYLA